jgi:hypothetical protein
MMSINFPLQSQQIKIALIQYSMYNFFGWIEGVGHSLFILLIYDSVLIYEYMYIIHVIQVLKIYITFFKAIF